MQLSRKGTHALVLHFPTTCYQWRNVWFCLTVNDVFLWYILFVTLRCFVSWFRRVYIAMRKRKKFHRKVLGRNNYEQITKNRLQSPRTKERQNCRLRCHIFFLCLCVSVSSCCVLVYMLTYVHECLIGKEVSYYVNGLLVGFGFNDPLRQNFSLYRAVSQREGERGNKG